MADDAKNTATTEIALKIERLKEISLPAAVLALDATPDGKTIYAACLDGAIYTVDVESGKPEQLARHDSYASGVALLPGAETLITAGYDGMLMWHDLKERKTIRKIKAHEFWSWQIALSPDGSLIASTTGSYQCGGFKYEPAPEREPSVKIFDTRTGELRQQLTHIPPVPSVVFSPDGKYLAAGNLMGEVRVWEAATGKQAAQFTTPSFTGWGIIKGHYYTGGIYGMMFTPDAKELLVCGMGTTTDPAAGNGKQLWQRFDWQAGSKLSETRDADNGAGLMETLQWHPARKYFAMAGRLFQGKWNLAFFDSATGHLLHSLDAKHRITKVQFAADGTRLILGKARGQEHRKDGKWPDFGQIEIYSAAMG